jgi:glycogen synthase
MKILIWSLPFAPSIGGTQSVSAVLAAEFSRAGHEVCVLTDTRGDETSNNFPYRVRRCVTPWALLREVKWCDVFFHNSLSIRKAWPLLLIRRPLVIAHQTWLAAPEKTGRVLLRSRIKFAVARAAVSISISSAIADHLGSPSVIIGNPYDERLFRILPEVERQPDLLFVGVLGKVKGVDVLVRALKKLWDRDVCVRLTVVGGGPEEMNLKALTQEMGLSEAVTFTGPLRGETLVREYNRHAIQVIPSRWAEPFGVIALEGIACGCVPIGTAQGGLRDAIGSCGMLVPNDDADALAEKIEYALQSADLFAYRANATTHIKKHEGREVAAAYLRVFQDAVEKRKS